MALTPMDRTCVDDSFHSISPVFPPGGGVIMSGLRSRSYEIVTRHLNEEERWRSVARPLASIKSPLGAYSVLSTAASERVIRIILSRHWFA